MKTQQCLKFNECVRPSGVGAARSRALTEYPKASRFG